MRRTDFIRDDAGAAEVMHQRGCVIPPMYEFVSRPDGVMARKMFMGWRVIDPQSGETRGAVVVYPSADGEDHEIAADGGWSVQAARSFFLLLFSQMRMRRVSARCKAENTRNLRVLQRIGFQIEGEKRLDDGNIILLGMFASECRLLAR